MWSMNCVRKESGRRKTGSETILAIQMQNELCACVCVCVCVCVCNMRCARHTPKPLNQTVWKWGQEIHPYFLKLPQMISRATRTKLPGWDEEKAKIKLLLCALSPNFILFLWIFVLTLLLKQPWVNLPAVQQSQLTDSRLWWREVQYLFAVC